MAAKRTVSAGKRGGTKQGVIALVSLRDWLLMMLSRDYPYTNAELLRFAKAHGHNVKMADVTSTVKAIASDLGAGRIRRTAIGALEPR